MNEQLRLTKSAKGQTAWPRHRPMDAHTRQIGLAGVAEARALLAGCPHSRFGKLSMQTEETTEPVVGGLDEQEGEPEIAHAA
ncbi:MAG: hypothetical protein QF638_02915 [Acidimicrobiales bacterium]|nr:hypothetical protein [Acidimicrobiales bacterium]MDP7257744.1 hypothetical protein [Acidimicrobiales bacterium]HJO79175.1 hypothetical protein [Acidimicrobiales bacterium]